MKAVKLFAVLSIGVIALAGGALAQGIPPQPGTPVAEGLSTPRGIAFDADGNLLVALAGSGGETIAQVPAIDDPASLVEMSSGLTGEVLAIAPDGTTSTRLGGLPSYALPSETIGLYRVIPNGDSLWLVISSAQPGAYWASSVVELDAETLWTKNIINLSSYEFANNPDGNELDSNVGDIAWAADGTLYIVDVGANTLYAWTAEGGLSVANVWAGNDVPTSIEIAENGDIYIGFLGQGIAPGAAKVEVWSAGELTATYGGLTAVTDILLAADGSLYAVQMFGDMGPVNGSVVSVTADGVTPVAEGIFAPFGIAQDADGALYVTYGTLAIPGGVLKITE